MMSAITAVVSIQSDLAMPSDLSEVCHKRRAAEALRERSWSRYIAILCRVSQSHAICFSSESTVRQYLYSELIRNGSTPALDWSKSSSVRLQRLACAPCTTSWQDPYSKPSLPWITPHCKKSRHCNHSHSAPLAECGSKRHSRAKQDQRICY